MSEQLIPTPGTFGENGNFLLECELGAGGMGGVYMGRDKMLDRPVAVKVMLKEYGEDAEFVTKFKKEAQSVARLIHPNIAQVYSYGICDGMPYMAMELAPGGSLYTVMKANPGCVDVTRALKICQQVAQALQCATDQGFVHGDVKPENILLDANGNAKLVDFGLAAMQKDTSEIWGTPYYISPEKVKKEPIDFRADIYSLGGTLYHALTGVAPFEGDDSIAVIKKRFEGAPKKPSEIRSELSPAVDALVMKMLALEKADRYPSFEALIEAMKDVLTNGLTSDEKKPSSEAVTKKTAPGGRRLMTVRGRRMMMKRPSGATSVKHDSDSEDEAAKDAEESETKSQLKHRKRINLDEGDDEEDEEGGGNLGLKVLGAVLGGILLIGGVIGGLVWYQIADKKAREADERAQIVAGIEKARSAIDGTFTAARNFADEFDNFAQEAIVAVQKPTDELSKMLKPEHAALLKPGLTKELLDAIASTNPPPVAAAATPTNAPAVVAQTNAPAAAAQVAAPAAKKPARKFRPPNDDEKDPASPEGEKYLADKKAFESSEAAAVEKGKSPKEEEKPAQKPAPEPEKKDEPPPPVVVTINELWERAYGCQACAIRIRQSVKKLLEMRATIDEIKDSSRENMEKLGELSRTAVEEFEKIKGSKDVDFVKKGIAYIKSKGEKTVEQTVKQIRIEKLEAERKAKKEAANAAEKARLEKIEADKKALIEKEQTDIRAKFDAIAAQGCFRQLDWKSALRQLETMKAGFTSAEGKLAADLQIQKVNDMKKVQDVFIKNMNGHVFKGKLKGAKVTSVNEKEISLLKADGKTKVKILWQKFYKDYPGNLNEIMNVYIVNARQPNAKFRISSLREWSDVMFGAALTMQLVCSEVNGALEKAETLAKETVKEFPDYQKTAQEIFPDIKFEVAEEE